MSNRYKLNPGLVETIVGSESVLPEFLVSCKFAVQHLFPAAAGGCKAFFRSCAPDAGTGEALHGRLKIRGEFGVHLHQDAAVLSLNRGMAGDFQPFTVGTFVRSSWTPPLPEKAISRRRDGQAAFGNVVGGKNQAGSQGIVIGLVQLHILRAIRLRHLAVVHAVRACEDGAAISSSVLPMRYSRLSSRRREEPVAWSGLSTTPKPEQRKVTGTLMGPSSVSK